MTTQTQRGFCWSRDSDGAAARPWSPSTGADATIEPVHAADCWFRKGQKEHTHVYEYAELRGF